MCNGDGTKIIESAEKKIKREEVKEEEEDL